jgi:hypothetical protein
MKATTKPVPGWYRDPSQRHEHRWWNGREWTPHVMSVGLRSLDYGEHVPANPSEIAVSEAPADDVDVGEEPVSTGAARAPRWPMAVWVTVLLGAGLLAVGSVLPWAEASSASASFSSSGIDGNGGATLVAAIAIGFSGALARRPRLVAVLVIGVAMLAGAIALHDALDVSEKADRLMQRLPSVSAGVGVGLWMTLAGGAIAVVGGVMAFVVASRHD